MPDEDAGCAKDDGRGRFVQYIRRVCLWCGCLLQPPHPITDSKFLICKSHRNGSQSASEMGLTFTCEALAGDMLSEPVGAALAPIEVFKSEPLLRSRPRDENPYEP